MRWRDVRTYHMFMLILHVSLAYVCELASIHLICCSNFTQSKSKPVNNVP